MEFAAFVALRPALRVLGFAGAILAEVFGGFGDGVCEELHFDAAEGFSWGRDGQSIVRRTATDETRHVRSDGE